MKFINFKRSLVWKKILKRIQMMILMQLCV